MTVQVTFSEEELTAIVEELGALPYFQVYELILFISQRIQESYAIQESGNVVPIITE